VPANEILSQDTCNYMKVSAMNPDVRKCFWVSLRLNLLMPANENSLSR
jgi:hypothetical protein